MREKTKKRYRYTTFLCCDKDALIKKAQEVLEDNEIEVDRKKMKIIYHKNNKYGYLELTYRDEGINGRTNLFVFANIFIFVSNGGNGNGVAEVWVDIEWNNPVFTEDANTEKIEELYAN